MENAVEALKMAFAVIVFSMALTIAFTMFTQAKNTSDIILEQEDEATAYEYYNYEEGQSAKYQKRVVGLETVIPTLYKYYKENYTVVFKQGTYINGQLYDVKNLVLYESESKYKSDGKILWGDYKWQTYWGDITDSNPNYKKICSFDMDEEIKRREPWSGKQSDTKQNIDLFLKGGEFISPDNNADRNTDYGEGFIKKYGKDAKFVEELGEYVYERDDKGNVNSSGSTTITINGETTSLLRKNKKRVITYTLITNM